jgi:magnesium transporter
MSDSRPLNTRTEGLFRRLVRREAEPALRKLLAVHRAEDIAEVMTHMTFGEQRRLWLVIQDRDQAAEILTLLPEESVAQVTAEMTEEVVADLLDRMDPDDAADVVVALPDDVRERVLAELDEGDEAEIKELMAYDPDTAGGLMSTRFFTMHDTASCGAAIRELQRVSDELSDVQYAYVVDREKRLVGVTSLRSLVVRPPNTPLAAIMTRTPISVRPDVDQEEVARIVERYDLMAIPVVDGENHMLGIVTVDDIVDVIRQEAAEDMLRMAGLSEEVTDEPGQNSVRMHVRTRVGWLLATICGGLLGSEIVGSFNGILGQIPILAGFIPVVMGMGGNVGLQSATVAVRSLATGRIDFAGAGPFIWREARVGLSLGLIYGGFLAAFGELRYTEVPGVGIAVGSAALTSMTASSLLGAGIPVALERYGLDPAVATGPLVTTCIDLIGVSLYLTLATLMLGQ